MFRRQITRALTLAVIGSLLMSTAVFADNAEVDVPGDNLGFVAKDASVAFGDVCRNTPTSKPVLVRVERQSQGTNVYASSASVSVSATSDNSKLTATTPDSISLPSNWASSDFDTVSNSTSTSVTVTSATTGAVTGTITLVATGARNGGGAAVSRDISFTVTANVVECDSAPPVLSLPADMSVEAAGPEGATVTYSATATDANPTNPTVTCSPASGSTFALGTTTVNCSATDAVGNQGTGNFKVTVADTLAPVVADPDDIGVEAAGPNGVTVTFDTPTATDVNPANPSVTCDRESGSVFALGETTVTCSATDAAGNTGSSSFTVTVSDTTDPILTVPENITVEATGPDGAEVDFEISASDLVDGDVTVTCLPASGSIFDLGTTTVNCSATDLAGNEGTASFDVTVEDTTAPTVTPPADIKAEATGPGGAAVSYTGESATDLVDGSVSPSCLPASGSTFTLGAHTVECSATDAAGNTGTASFTITVVDETPPALTLPADQLLEATGPGGAAATFTASAEDLVDGDVDVTCSAASGNTFPLGTTTVTCEATDAAGNTATGDFEITVEDTTAPAITVPDDKTVEATGPSGAVVTFAASAEDVVDGEVDVTCDPASGATFDLGRTTVTCKATDAAKNEGTASFDITVEDTTAPAISVPANMTVEATSASGAAVTFSASASDLVDGSITPGCTSTSGGTFALGTTTVTCKATDAAGNEGTGSFDITVVDTTAPAMTLPANIAVQGTGPTGAVVSYTASATDAVDGTVAVNCAPASGSTFGYGTTTANCSATDAAGNTSTGSFTVTVSYRLSGFYQPVDMNGTLNTVKAGSTVPLKFELFAGSTEITSTSAIASFKVGTVPCGTMTGVPTDDIELYSTGGTTLRYDTTGGQFIQNWQVPRGAGICYKVTMTAIDGGTITAYFKTK